MRREFPAWAAGLAIGTGCGTLLWVTIETAVKDSSGIGLALSMALALAVTHLRTTAVQRRRAWLAAEAAALSPTQVR